MGEFACAMMTQATWDEWGGEGAVVKIIATVLYTVVEVLLLLISFLNGEMGIRVAFTKLR